MTLEEWLRTGYQLGFCGPLVCSTHDGVPTTAEEDEEFEKWEEPCVNVIRVYESPEIKAAVEANHSPTRWRASNAGLV